jgi:hypothetical protein
MGLAVRAAPASRCRGGPVRDKRQKIRHPWEVLDLSTRIMREAPNRHYRERDHWLAEDGDGAFLALVATRPLRRRTFWQLRYGYELRRDEAGYVLDIHDKLPEDGWLLDGASSGCAHSVAQSLLHRDPAPDAEGPGDGQGLGDHRRDRHVRPIDVCAHPSTDLREFGVAMNLHVFRDCMMTAIAIFDHKNVAIGQFMLQQRSPRSGTKFYNLVGKVEAAQRCQGDHC